MIPRAATDRTATGPAPTHVARTWRTAWPPALAAVTGCVAVLARYGTPIQVSTLFVVYLVVLVAVPGTVGWRLLTGSRGPLTEQVVIGSSLALATQAILGFALSPLHVSSLSWLWAPGVLALSLLPRLRRVAWRRPRPSRDSTAAAWTQAAAVLAAVVWVGATALATHPLVAVDGAGPWVRAVPSSTYVDMPFHQSVAAGVDTYYPLVFPYLDDEPLHYHLLAYEHLASVTAVTGIDLTWVLYRLDAVALAALAVMAVAVLARRASDLGRAAPAAAVLSVLGSALAPYGWTGSPFGSSGLLNLSTFRSPTQAFAEPLLLGTLTVTAAILGSPSRAGPTRRERQPRRGGLWVAFAILAVGAGGAKSTTLPVLVAGLALVVLVALARRRSARRPAVLLGITVAAFGVLAVVFLRGQTGSLAVEPLGIVDVFGVTSAVGAGASVAGRTMLGLLGVAAWLSAGAGAVLLVRRGRREDPVFALLVGTTVAGVAAALLTTASGSSEIYFLHASWPVLAALTAWGWAEASSTAVEQGRRRPFAVVSVLAAALGPGLVLLARAVGGGSVPTHVPGDLPVRALVGPWLVIAAGAAVAAAVVFTLGGRGRRGALLAVTLVALAFSSATVVSHVGELAGAVRQVAAGVLPAAEGTPIPLDGARAALFVRDRSAVGDVVATNAHCLGPTDPCDARHFWVSALTERRVLVEGWAYPDGYRPGQTRTSPFWDADRYAANEAVFTAPTEEAVDLLRDRYGVRWLFVDRTVAPESERLRDYAELVLDDGDAAVYRIDG